MESGTDLKQEACLLESHPPAISGIGNVPAILLEPSIILGEGDSITLWYLPGALTKPIQEINVKDHPWFKLWEPLFPVPTTGFPPPVPNKKEKGKGKAKVVDTEKDMDGAVQGKDQVARPVVRGWSQSWAPSVGPVKKKGKERAVEIQVERMIDGVNDDKETGGGEVRGQSWTRQVGPLKQGKEKVTSAEVEKERTKDVEQACTGTAMCRMTLHSARSNEPEMARENLSQSIRASNTADGGLRQPRLDKVNRALAHEETSGLFEIYEMPELRSSTSMSILRTGNPLTSLPVSTAAGMAAGTPQRGMLLEEMHNALLHPAPFTDEPYPPCYTTVVNGICDIMRMFAEDWQSLPSND
ncbi:hypothetical protein SCLCIDRAFT_31881 [Scleroderma citrinum Foug A]|uniref:Uncharacterized protein n=1 Tax=Scleroderma citrinum Foug A TaxID=1036808 RepID=A0A0C2ZLD8_9AGAM|nr:hypothetical protein SCLCIDRAFT_31881 [Scleroderma citrinum Foug A]